MSWQNLADMFPGAKIEALKNEAQAIATRKAPMDLPVPHYQDVFYGFIRLAKPAIVVETGVEYGISDYFILSALLLNEGGELYSCDVMYKTAALMLKETQSRVGKFPKAPNFIPKPSRDALPSLIVAGIKTWDIFLHDSDHEVWNTTYEYEFAYHFVKPGGYIASDDYTWAGHGSWHKFCERHRLAFTTLGNAAIAQKPLTAPLADPLSVDIVQAQAIVLADRAKEIEERFKK